MKRMTSFAGWLDEALDVTQGTSEFEPKKKYTIEDYQKIIILSFPAKGFTV